MTAADEILFDSDQYHIFILLGKLKWDIAINWFHHEKECDPWSRSKTFSIIIFHYDYFQKEKLWCNPLFTSDWWQDEEALVYVWVLVAT